MSYNVAVAGFARLRGFIARHKNFTMSKKKQNLLSVYSIVSQLTFIVVTPLLLFLWGGGWLIDRFDLPSWVRVLSIFLAVFTMAAGFITFFRQLIRQFGKDDEALKRKQSETATRRFDRRDNDYYADDNDRDKPLF
jgi:hypothetical protein